jgi:hypothetical protein
MLIKYIHNFYTPMLKVKITMDLCYNKNSFAT